MRNFQFHKLRRFNTKDIAIVRHDLHLFVLLNKLQGVSQLLLIQSNLLIRIRIHEIIEHAVIIQILHILTLDDRTVYLFRRTEGTLDHTTACYALQRSTDKRRTLTRLYMLEFDNGINIALKLDRQTIPKLTCGNYICHINQNLLKINSIDDHI